MKKIFAVIFAVCALFLLTQTCCAEPVFTRFWFTRGGYLPPDSYEVFTVDGDWYLCRNEGPSWKIDDEYAEAVDAMIRDWNVLAWDGFKGSDPDVLDGEGFALQIEKTDGTKIYASGENYFPDGYYGVTTELDRLFGEDQYNPENKPEITGVYVYTGEDGKTVTIRVNEDETYSAEGEGISLSGTWFIEGSRFYMSGQSGYWYSNEFIPVENALFYSASASDGTDGLGLPEMARFVKPEDETMTEAYMEAFTTPTATLVIEVNGKIYYAALEDNPSAEAFFEKLKTEPLEVDAHDYGNFEKVGDLPWTLPRSDEEITTEPGDIILYQGNQITLYYDVNTWNFTRLARIGNVTREELLEVCGEGDTTLKFWLEWSE